MMGSGKNLNDIQELNRSLILRLVLKNTICSRAFLAKESGLKQATITNIINGFLDWGIVEETGTLAGSKGRRSIGVAINRKAFYVLGVRLTRNFFDIALFDIAGQPVHRKTVDNRKASGPPEVVAAIRREIEAMRAANRDKRILCVGMAVPGPFFYHDAKIALLTDFPGWNDIDFKREIMDRVPLPTIIDHDANAGALAEWWIAPNEMKDGTIVYFAAGQGLGAGILNDGAIFRGALGIAGEIGHMSVDVNGPLCACGNHGCLTNYVSTTYALQRVRERLADHPGSALDSDADFPRFVRAVRDGDPLADSVYREIMRYFSAGIINALWAYGPNEIIIGDEMSAIGQPMLDLLRGILSRSALKRFTDQVRIRLSSFEDDPAFIGSAALAIDYCLANTQVFETV